MGKKTGVKLLTAALALLAWGSGSPAMAVSAGANPSVVAEATDKDVTIAPMPDSAKQGAACLGLATASMATAYAVGPAELMMVATGAMHVASGSSVMFLPMMSIIGGGTCAMGAAAWPAVSRAIDWTGRVTDRFTGTADKGQLAMVGAENAAKDVASAVSQPMSEHEIQGTGCIVGALAGFGASMATSPMEVAMLSSGATTVASSTPILGMALVGTIIASSCGIGALSALPVVALADNFHAIGHSLVAAAGSAVMVASSGVSQAFAVLTGNRESAVVLAEGEAAAR
ncbi:MAG: hypothetical protein WCF85_04840 [Rhodospirillaceae bacterium]